VLIEAVVETAGAAVAAERGGAGRLELCAQLEVGGTTPDEVTIARVVKAVAIPVFVMIRPRGGSFVHSGEEIEAMNRGIAVAAANGASGIVLGVLRPDNRVDVERTRALVQNAYGLPVTFHRAIDETPDLLEAIESLIDAGVSRVLTSGGAATAAEGVELLASLVDRAGSRLTVMPGGGIRAHNARALIERTRAREIHTRFVDETGMRALAAVAHRLL
jgi:copper homeostasis protein